MKRVVLSIAAGVCLIAFPIGCASTVTENIERKPAGSPQEAVSSKTTGFIDTHNHLFGRFSTRLGGEEIDYEGAAKVAMAAMKQSGIKKMFIMPPPFSPGHRGQYTFDDLIGVVKKFPDRFAFLGGGGTLNVMIHQAVQDETLKRGIESRFKRTAVEILSRGAIGFGELTAEHLSLRYDHPYESAPPDHPLFLLLSDIAARHGVPIDIHMEAVPKDMPLPKIRRLESPHNPKVLHSNIAAFERLLAHNRNAKVIWAHAGWCNTGHRTPELCAELLGRHSNLYMSFKIRPDSMAQTRPLAEDLRIKPDWLNLIRTYPDRFVIGSDHFYGSPRAPTQIRPHRGRGVDTEHLLAALSPELAHKVGYENALHLFKLK
ncbi:MAG: amidohydrolase family protein [Thermodesulfobacteriota bacterium]